LSRIRIEPEGDNCTKNELEAAMEATPSKTAYVRLQVIRSLLLGISRENVVAQFCVSDRRVRDWIHRFNESGIDGLIEVKTGRGRKRKISVVNLGEKFIELVNSPKEAGYEHWTAVKLHGYLKKEYQVELGYSTVVRYLHEHNMVLRFPRPWATGPGKDEEKREAFRAELDALRASDDVRVWFSDETGIEGDPRPRRRWAEKGSEPKLDYHGGHLRRTVIGSVQPESGEYIRLSNQWVQHRRLSTLPRSQLYLDHMAISCQLIAGKKDIIILDNASWHKTKSLNWHHFTPLFLPAYSPDFNPIERVWKYLKEEFMAEFYTREGRELEEKIDNSLRKLTCLPETLISISSNW